MRRLALVLAFVVALTGSIFPGIAVADPSLKDQLVGPWTLVSIDVTAQDCAKRQDFGANPKGILILDASGRYAAVQSQVDRPKFKGNGNIRRDTPAAEFGEAARAFGANFGAWSVNEADQTLIRKFEGALVPNAEGQETKSTISLSGNELKLSSTSPSGVKTDAAYKR